MRYLALFCLSLVLNGCDSGAKRRDVPQKARAAAAEPARPAETRPRTAPREGDAQAFWEEFRAAALASDTRRLRGLTHFPFTTRGDSDWDPVIEHDSAAFDTIMPRLLEQPSYTMDGATTERELLRGTPKLDAENLSLSKDGWFRVNTFEFKRIGGVWRLTHAFTDEVTEGDEVMEGEGQEEPEKEKEKER